MEIRLWLDSLWADQVYRKRLIGAAALILAFVLGVWAGNASAAPPYSVTATFVPAPSATSHRLYQGCRTGETKVLIGSVTSGQTFTNLLTVAGEYSFCVHGVNTAGEGPRSNIAVVNISDVNVPGAPSNFQITITCSFLPDGVTPSCTFTVTNVP